LLVLTTVFVCRNLPPLKTTVAPVIGIPALSRTKPVMRPAVDIQILLGLDPAVVFGVEVTVRALLIQPGLLAVIATELLAGEAME
jgi:hypothetical protein